MKSYHYRQKGKGHLHAGDAEKDRQTSAFFMLYAQPDAQAEPIAIRDLMHVFKTCTTIPPFEEDYALHASDDVPAFLVRDLRKRKMKIVDGFVYGMRLWWIGAGHAPAPVPCLYAMASGKDSKSFRQRRLCVVQIAAAIRNEYLRSRAKPKRGRPKTPIGLPQAQKGRPKCKEGSSKSKDVVSMETTAFDFDVVLLDERLEMAWEFFTTHAGLFTALQWVVACEEANEGRARTWSKPCLGDWLDMQVSPYPVSHDYAWMFVVFQFLRGTRADTWRLFGHVMVDVASAIKDFFATRPDTAHRNGWHHAVVQGIGDIDLPPSIELTAERMLRVCML